MRRSPRFLPIIAAALAAMLALAGLTASTAAASPEDPEVIDGLSAETEVEPSEIDGPTEHVVLFSADVRVDGQRVEDEWYLALGYDDRYPFTSSLWLLVDAENDDWVPLCIGWVPSDDDGALFGHSTLGEDGDGCALAALGDDESVFFGVVELEGESVLTASLYPIWAQ